LSKIICDITRSFSVPDRALIFSLLFIAGLAGCEQDSLVADQSIVCDSCENWNRPLEPFQVFGNTYYVGTVGLGSVLIDTGDGLILIDGGLPQSAPMIEKNIRELGFRAKDIRAIVASHAHYDHVGGISALQRYAAASVYASHETVRALRAGASPRKDPQYSADLPEFPPVTNTLGIDDGWVFEMGNTKLEAVYTPGHTLGSTSWTWQTCESGYCVNVVYADSLTPVSAPGYRFRDGMGRKLRRSVERVAALPCDIMLSTHDHVFDLHRKRAGGKNAFIDDQACKLYAERTLRALERRLETER
jgi:metallo-beta-lactamase class B